MGAYAVIIDSRSYPARSTEEPQNDRVMRGSRDGFVETLISNTALIRRRIRDTSLTMRHITVGSQSKSDVVLCFMADRADRKYVASLTEKLRTLKVGTLTMGHQSLIEAMLGHGYINPFPKVRLTERPDVAAAQLYEGSVLLLIDNTPEVMVLPTSIFDFMQETNDFYFPPLTGTYLRIVRQIIFFLTLFLIPAWYLLTRESDIIPVWLHFLLPTESGELPIIAQLLLVEFIVDGLKMASMNTPDMLSNSLSVVGGLILGDFAINLGWLIPEVILLEAFVAIANFSQRSYELGYAFKFLRIMLLILCAIFGLWGFFGGVALIIIFLCTTKNLNGERTYLYPLIPFDAKGFLSVFFRVRKKDTGRGD
jgi:stage V sporulation protein AF